MARDGSNDGRRWRRFFLVPLVACAGAALGVSAAVAASATLARTTQNWAKTATRQLAQSEDIGQDQSIGGAEVQKYVAVYAAMQRDHKLTVEQAVARQGMTLDQFRSLENRIQRNPVVHARVIKKLRAAAKDRAEKASPTHGH